MGKRAQREHDATMEVSASQLVVPKPPTAPRVPPGGKNDASLWAYRVVGTDDFVPSPPRRESRRGRWIAVGVLGAAAAAGVSYALVSYGTDDAPAETAAAKSDGDKPADKPATPDKPADKPAPPAKVADAKPAKAADAKAKVADAAPAKAGDAPDAITSADPKATKHKRAVKKTAAVTTKKKPAKKR